jgi:hypothetical protein
MSIFNLGEPDDYRVPDGGLLRERLNLDPPVSDGESSEAGI